MFNEIVASQHIGHGRNLPIITATEFYRWPRLGTNANAQRCHFWSQFVVHGKLFHNFIRQFAQMTNAASFSLVQDLLNFDDPLNNDAADQYLRDKKEFQSKVREYIATFCTR